LVNTDCVQPVTSFPATCQD